MLFHYGNCRKEVEELESIKKFQSKKINDLDCQILVLIGQVQEGKALYDYQVGILEKEVEVLKRELGSLRCVSETLEKENANLNRLISKKDDEIKSLRAVADNKETTELSTKKRQLKDKK